MPDRPLDAFLPAWDAREHSRIVIRAPADRVWAVVRRFDLYSIAPIRVIFRTREKLMRAKPTGPRRPQPFLDEMLALGWKPLVERPGELFVAGAACQPWLADVRFEPIPAERFRDFSSPDRVKIAWTLELRPLGDARTELATETRALATDDASRRRFRAYWRWARFGILSIRPLLLRGIRREAEHPRTQGAVGL